MRTVDCILRVEMPDGARFEVPADWTTLESTDGDRPRLHARLVDFCALADLLNTMEVRYGLAGGQATWGADAVGGAAAERG